MTVSKTPEKILKMFSMQGKFMDLGNFFLMSKRLSVGHYKSTGHLMS